MSKIVFSLLLALLPFIGFTQTVFLSTQTDVDVYCTTYDCTNFTGNLNIPGPGISNINALSGVKILVVAEDVPNHSHPLSYLPTELGRVLSLQTIMYSILRDRSFILIFCFESSHYINITPTFKAKTKNKIIYSRINSYL